MEGDVDQFSNTEEYLERSFKNMEHSFKWIFDKIGKLIELIARPLENLVGNFQGSEETGEDFF